MFTFIIDWLRGSLATFGLAYKDAHIPIRGLDNAGKTTLVHMLKYDQEANATTTRKFTVQLRPRDVIVGNVKFTIYDIGGIAFREARRPWRDYVQKIDGIVFLVDCSDSERFPDAKSELHTLLSMEEFAKVPVLVLGNKIDSPGAVSEEHLRCHLGLGSTTGKGKIALNVDVRPIEVFMCSAIWRQGYGDAFRWLAKYV
ncbi:ARF/SAR superfamily [Gyrodon lividus]|nr:ARF/SAR superfamily [Gyrodon lividus]